MSGDFKIGHGADMSRIDPDTCPYLKLTGRGSCRWYKGVAATTIGMTGGFDPPNGTAYRLLGRDTDDGPGKTLIISNMIFEGDLGTTMKQLGDASRLIALDNYERVELYYVEGRWGSQMGFTFGYCNQVRANRIRLDHIARDGFNASNCADIAVTDSDFEWIIDDCCAANLSAVVADDPGQHRAFRFMGNRVFQCQGVKLWGRSLFRAPASRCGCPPASRRRPAFFCNGPLEVNPFFALRLSPGSRFCPGSAPDATQWGRHLMVSDEEQAGQSAGARFPDDGGSAGRVYGLT